MSIATDLVLAIPPTRDPAFSNSLCSNFMAEVVSPLEGLILFSCPLALVDSHGIKATIFFWSLYRNALIGKSERWGQNPVTPQIIRTDGHIALFFVAINLNQEK